MDIAEIAAEIMELTVDELEAKWQRATQQFSERVSQGQTVTVEPSRLQELEQLFYAATAHAKGDVER